MVAILKLYGDPHIPLVVRICCRVAIWKRSSVFLFAGATLC